MSKREKAIQLLNEVPEYKIEYVIAYLQGMTAGEKKEKTYDEIEPDKFDLDMIAEAGIENSDNYTLTLEELNKELGVE